MDLESHRIFILKFKEEYKKIRYIECPAFSGEKVYFNKHGFNHLIRKGKNLRTICEQIRRIKLMPYADVILSESDKIESCVEDRVDGYPAFFWSLSTLLRTTKIIIIIRQLGNGRKHFFSIMDELL